MDDESCHELKYLPIHLSWNRHCGGGWWDFSTRLFTLADSALLTRISILIAMRAGPFNKILGLGLFSKAVNDTYEAARGGRGALRDALGDELYLAMDLSLMGYGLLKKIPKMNYLGNPMKDFFTKDPNNYEYAFRQYGAFEAAHLVVSSGMTASNHYDTYSAMLSIEESWQRHLDQVRIDYD